MFISAEAIFFDLRTKAIEINRTFADMEPLLARTVYLSLNAEIASSHLGDTGKPFGIVVKELSYMGSELDELIKEIEREFSKVVFAVSKWIASERKMAIILKSLNHSNEGLTVGNEGGRAISPYNNNCSDTIAFIQLGEEKIKILLQKYKEDTLQNLLLSEAMNCRKEIIHFAEKISNITGKLSGIIDKINRVAVRQSHFVAVTAAIEAAQLKANSSHIKTVANSIKKLSQDIHRVENEAKNKLLSLASLSSQLFRNIKK